MKPISSEPHIDSHALDTDRELASSVCHKIPDDTRREVRRLTDHAVRFSVFESADDIEPEVVQQ